MARKPKARIAGPNSANSGTEAANSCSISPSPDNGRTFKRNNEVYKLVYDETSQLERIIGKTLCIQFKLLTS
jgi:hypothetical protein